MSKVALVTGANKGIGYETARQLASAGHTVLVAARTVAKAEAAADQLNREKLDVLPIALDVTSRSDREAAVRDTEQRFGRLDVLVNNAGILLSEDGPADQVKESELRQTFETNFFGAVLLTQALLPLLRKSEAGRIVNVSSILGSLSYQSKQTGGAFDVLAYNASKAALNMFTIHLARALRRTPVKVNAVHPGWVKTEVGGPNAPLAPSQGAKFVVRFASLGPDGPTGTFAEDGEVLPW